MSVVSGQWSVVSGQWSVVSGQWSVVSGVSVLVTFRSSTLFWLLATGHFFFTRHFFFLELQPIVPEVAFDLFPQERKRRYDV